MRRGAQASRHRPARDLLFGRVPRWRLGKAAAEQEPMRPRNPGDIRCGLAVEFPAGHRRTSSWVRGLPGFLLPTIRSSRRCPGHRTGTIRGQGGAMARTFPNCEAPFTWESAMVLSPRAAALPLISLLGLTLVFASPVRAQEQQQVTPPPAATQAQTPAPAPSSTATPAPVPAPHQSSLYAHDDASAPTIAAAQKDHADAMLSRNHTATYSTTVLVLVVIILVLLIA